MCKAVNMKKLILLLHFIPLMSFAQTFGDTKSDVKLKLNYNYEEKNNRIIQKTNDGKNIITYGFGDYSQRLFVIMFTEFYDTQDECINNFVNEVKKLIDYGYEAEKVSDTHYLFKVQNTDIGIDISIKYKQGYYIVNTVQMSDTYR